MRRFISGRCCFSRSPLISGCSTGIASGVAAGKAKPRWRQAAVSGWWFGFGFFAAGLYWIGFAFFVEADKFAALLPLAVAGFPGALACSRPWPSAAALP
ncbi:MAG: hypothetical protein HC850_13925, partial [Rhodomicrobium sp.]|nr:hypothetical protein [Rhodomicrobium sp.]